ncbi:unnamed protein product [Closterium sp. NIES-65]|nr:unnamed protein product [Closterium sp. NIES-65]
MALQCASMRNLFLLAALCVSSGIWGLTGRVEAATTPTENAALLGMKAFMSPATLFASWKGDACDDKWMGIICSTTVPQHVVGINLESLGVKGLLSKHIAWLPFLQILNLQDNQFAGELPKEIGTLKFLEHIDVRLNKFTGPFPDTTLSTNLKYVELSKNDFKGPFPESLLGHDKIIYIGLAGNSFRGPLPLDFSGLKSLTHMSLADNKFNGTLPESIGALPNIEAVDVSKNNFVGTVPATYQNIQKLKVKGNPKLEGGKGGKGGRKKGGKKGRKHGKRGKHGKGDAPGSAAAPSSEPSPAAPPSEAPASAAAPSSEPSPAAPPSEAPASEPAVKPPTKPVVKPLPGGVAPLPDPTEQPSAPGSLPPPVVRPPVVKPPVVKPPVIKPPVIKPPVIKPPVIKPPVVKPPIVTPPVVKPPVVRPPVVTPPVVTPVPPIAEPSLPSTPELPPAPVTECDTCNLNQVAWRPMADDSTSANPKLSSNASACVCVYPLRFRLHMSMNYANFDEKKQRDLEMQLADDLIVNYGQVRLLSSRPGSVVADLALGPEAPMTTLQPAVVERVLALLRNNQLSLSGFGFVEVTLVEPPSELLLPAPTNQTTPDQAAPEEGSGGWSAAAIAGVIVGTVLVVALIFLVVVLVRCRPRRSGGSKKSSSKKGGSSKRVSATSVVTASSAAHHVHSAGGKPPMHMQSWSNNSARAHPPHGAASASLAAAAAAAAGGHGSNTPGGSTRRVPGVVVLTLAEVQMATDNFSSERSVNSDPLGTTFVGTLPSGQEIAVKRVEPSVVEGQSDDDFVAVASNMARLKHPNVVQLQGYCVDYGERVLVFEHYPHGSLFDQLHGNSKVPGAAEPSQHMTWAVRIDIAIATARALVYLHEECVPSIIHRNISSRNILLDKRLKARVAGAGLSFLNPVGADDKSLSDQLVGGFAYNAPEYAMSGIYTAKSDVYSFGVVLLELLTGRKPVDPSKPKPESSLVRWAAPLLHNPQELESILDSKIAGPLPDAARLAAFAEVITRCIQPEPEFRPSMSKIVSDLNHKVKVLQPGSSRHRTGSASPASSLNGSLAGSVH